MSIVNATSTSTISLSSSATDLSALSAMFSSGLKQAIEKAIIGEVGKSLGVSPEALKGILDASHSSKTGSSKSDSTLKDLLKSIKKCTDCSSSDTNLSTATDTLSKAVKSYNDGSGTLNAVKEAASDLKDAIAAQADASGGGTTGASCGSLGMMSSS